MVAKQRRETRWTQLGCWALIASRPKRLELKEFIPLSTSQDWTTLAFQYWAPPAELVTGSLYAIAEEIALPSLCRGIFLQGRTPETCLFPRLDMQGGCSILPDRENTRSVLRTKIHIVVGGVSSAQGTIGEAVSRQGCGSLRREFTRNYGRPHDVDSQCGSVKETEL